MRQERASDPSTPRCFSVTFILSALKKKQKKPHRHANRAANVSMCFCSAAFLLVFQVAGGEGRRGGAQK